MDRKFYVSYEAARLLKEKGYRDKTMYGYCSKDQSMHTLDTREDYDWNYPDDEFYSTETGYHVEMFAAPTKAEAIDWLESKGITIDIHWIRFNENRRWNYSIFNCSTCDTIDTKYIFPTRLEAEEAAIIKALEQL